jgi:hypothetical protein
MAKRCLLALPLILFFTPLSVASDLHQYAGKSSCSPGLERGVGSYGIRLDKRQITRLEARTSNGNEILMIVQYTNERDECGVVRDIVQAQKDKVRLVFEGNDDGSDLVKWAKQRAGKKRLSNQNDPNAR